MSLVFYQFYYWWGKGSLYKSLLITDILSLMSHLLMEGLKSYTLSFAWNSTTLSSQIWYPVFFNFTDKISRPSFIGKEGSIYFLRFVEKIGYQMLSVIMPSVVFET